MNPSNTPILHPRSPRETMAGWVYLPRFVDKIRLHLAGKLHSDYQDNFTKGFDAKWLVAAGIDANQFIDVVRNSSTDGEVCDWVRVNAAGTVESQSVFREHTLQHGREDDPALRARLKLRKEQAGLAHRDDIQTFADFIDADEGRT